MKCDVLVPGALENLTQKLRINYNVKSLQRLQMVQLYLKHTDPIIMKKKILVVDDILA